MFRLVPAIALLCLVFLGTGCRKPPATAVDAKQYYAVLLSNGSVYFGNLEGLGSPYPVLRDVYYVQSTTNPETKAVTSVLVKRGKEWHGPDRMIINEKAIIFIEPVGPDSKVAQLISESKR